MTNRETLNSLLPFQCRIMAIEELDGKIVRRSVKRIMADSGLSRRAIARLSYAKIWRGFHAETWAAFGDGCGIDLFAQDPLASILERLPNLNLEHLEPRQRRLYEKLREA